MRPPIVVFAILLFGCDNQPAAPTAPEIETRLETTGPPSPPPPPAPPPDRCIQVADHFEPWRRNALWNDELSPRPQMIEDCRRQQWSIQLTDCILRSHSPLELDDCIQYSPDGGG